MEDGEKDDGQWPMRQQFVQLRGGNAWKRRTRGKGRRTELVEEG